MTILILSPNACEFFVLSYSLSSPLLFRVQDLNMACTDRDQYHDRCEAISVECVLNCAADDTACISQCFRENTECLNGKLNRHLWEISFKLLVLQIVHVKSIALMVAMVVTILSVIVR